MINFITKENFGGILKSGIECIIIKTEYYHYDKKYHVAIMTYNGAVYWGLLEDLNPNFK